MPLSTSIAICDPGPYSALATFWKVRQARSEALFNIRRTLSIIIFTSSLFSVFFMTCNKRSRLSSSILEDSSCETPSETSWSSARKFLLFASAFGMRSRETISRKGKRAVSIVDMVVPLILSTVVSPLDNFLSACE